MNTRHRDHLEDSVFRWARTEMKREKVMASSSYAKIAGLQSEIGRVVVTRVAGSELEYKRTLNMYRKDMTVTVNNIRREQIKMRRTMVKYLKKLKQTRQENLKRQREEEARDIKRRSLEAVQMGFRFDVASSTTPEHSGTGDALLPSGIEFREGPVCVRVESADQQGDQSDVQTNGTQVEGRNKKKNDTLGLTKENKAYSPILPMINEDKECEETEETEIRETKKTKEHSLVSEGQEGEETEHKSVDDEISISSNGRRRKPKKEVSFSDIIKLRYANTKQLFNMVHILASKHGITDPVDTIPDPRDNVVLRGSTDDSFRLQAAVLYPMKYGYNVGELEEPTSVLSPHPPLQGIPHLAPSQETTSSSRISSGGSGREVSVEKRRERFLSGRTSVSVDNSNSVLSTDMHTERVRKFSEPRLKVGDTSLPLLVEKVAKVKLDQTERMTEADQTFRLLTASKPSSSRSTKSLPPLSKLRPHDEEKSVSWTEAFGLLRAIHSLENVAS